MKSLIFALCVVLVVMSYCDGATTKKKTTTKAKVKPKPKITAVKKVLKTTTKNPWLRSLPLPVDPNAPTPPPEYNYYEEDIDNPEYVADEDDVEETDDYEETDEATTTNPQKPKKKKAKKSLRQFLRNLAKKSKKNGQRWVNRIGNDWRGFN